MPGWAVPPISATNSKARIIPIGAVAAVLACAVVLFAAWFVAHERWIYFWDWSHYWRKTIDLAGRLHHDWLGAMRMVLRSVRHSEYGIAAVVPLAPATLLFGESRLVYILSIVVLYGLPAVGVLAFFTQRAFLRPVVASTLATAACIVTIGLLPQLWLPVFVGLPDIVGCIVIPLVWWLVRGPVERASWSRIAGAGLALALLVLLRRWYAYWVVSLLVALAIDGAWRARGGAATAAAWCRVAGLGAVALATFLLFTGSLGLRMLQTDYGDLYSAYRSADPLHTAAVELVRDFGPFWLALAAGGAGLTLYQARTRALARLLLLQALATVVLFTRTQNFGSHHYYLLIPQIAVFAGALAGALASIRHAALRATLCAGLGSILLLDFLSVFVPGVQPALGPLAAAFASRVYYPMVRDDLDEVARLTRVLDALTRDGSEKIYVLSSSVVLNEEVPRNAHLVDASLPDLDPRILRTSHVDKRDGFPWRLEVANYVVLTAPVGYHLDPKDQRVIGIPARALANGTTIGRSFARLPDEFLLDGGTRVSIFKRNRDLAKEDLDAILAEFQVFYPDRPAFARR